MRWLLLSSPPFYTKRSWGLKMVNCFNYLLKVTQLARQGWGSTWAVWLLSPHISSLYHLVSCKTGSVGWACKGMTGVRGHPWAQFSESSIQTDTFPRVLVKLPAGLSGVGRMAGKPNRQAGDESCFGLKDWHFNKLLLINSTLKFWVACFPS